MTKKRGKNNTIDIPFTSIEINNFEETCQYLTHTNSIRFW